MQLALMCQGSSGPTEEEAGSLLHALQQRFTGLCALLHGVAACQAASPTLHAAVSGAAKALLMACKEFLEALPEQVCTSCPWRCRCMHGLGSDTPDPASAQILILCGCMHSCRACGRGCLSGWG